MILYPPPLKPGDRIGITAPSSGVGEHLMPRFNVAVQALRDQGYEAQLGNCLDGTSHISAPKEQRAEELMAMLTDPSIRAVFPPWGGETAIDLLDQLDWAALAAAEPTWVVGFSDTTTWMTPLTLRLDWATLHGVMLMDEPIVQPAGIARWTELASATQPITQHSLGRHRSADRDDIVGNPELTEWLLDEPGLWSTLSGEPVHVTGRLIGGCIETLTNIRGTEYGDLPGWAARQAEGTIVYLEAAEDDAATICRSLHAMRYSGWFDAANAIMIGRTHAKDIPTLTQREAVVDALGMLDLPIIFDVECGHTAPRIPLLNGALAEVTVEGPLNRITQSR